MASHTENLNLLKKDPVADGSDTFNIRTMLNDNWDKLDANAAAVAAELAGKVNKSGDTMTGNLAIANGNGYFESGLFSEFGFLKLTAVNGENSTRIQIETGADRDPFIEHVVNGVVVNSVKIATATPPEEYDLPLVSGIANLPGVQSTYGKDQFCRVTVNLMINHSDNSAFSIWAETVATLPPEYRPNSMISANGIAVSDSTSGSMGVTVLPDGSIQLCPYAKTHTRITCTFEFIARN